MESGFVWCENAVIISDDGRNIEWRPKCPDCWYVDTTSQMSSLPFSGAKLNIGHKCQYCKNTFIVHVGRK